MPTERSPRMSAGDFRKLLDAMKATDPATGTQVTVITDDIRNDLYPHSNGNDITIHDWNVLTTPDGIPYCTGSVDSPNGDHVADFILFWNEDEYIMDVTKTLDPARAFIALPDVIKNIAPREAAVRAYTAYMRPDCFPKENAPGAPMPLYAARAIENTLGENGYARTGANKKILYDGTKAHMRPGLEPTQINWLAFQDAMLMNDEQFGDAMGRAFTECEDANKLDRRSDDVTGDCFDRDFFADPGSPWPASNPEPQLD